MSTPLFPLDPEDLAETIDIPLAEWPGNCHGVAEAVLRHAPIAGMRLVRGHFTGHIARDSVYRSAGIQQHSWLQLEDGRILDPTRWAMTNPKRPSIYVGLNDDYDEGGAFIRAQSRPHMAFSKMVAGRENTAEAAILKRLQALDPDIRSRLAEASGVTQIAGDEISYGAAESLKLRLEDPVEHHRDPEAFYAAAAAAGLKALIGIDSWTRVMEPEKVTPRFGANMLFEAPPAEEMTDPQRLFRVFAKFLSIEERDLYIEDELAEYGYRLDELHEALNEMENWLRFDPDLPYFPNEHADLLCVVAGDLLGKGFGQEIRVERFARSLGLDRDAFHCALVTFSKPVGYDLAWLIGDEARAAEATHDILAQGLREDEDALSPS